MTLRTHGFCEHTVTHVTYCYHCEGPHTLYHNDRHAFLFLSLSLCIIKNAPQIQQPDAAYDFKNTQKPEYSGIYKPESTIHQ